MMPMLHRFGFLVQPKLESRHGHTYSMQCILSQNYYGFQKRELCIFGLYTDVIINIFLGDAVGFFSLNGVAQN